MENQENQIPPKKLYRSNRDRIIAGVCGGLAEYFDIDSIVIRAIFLLLIIPGGTGFWLYLVLLILIPRNPNQPSASGETEKKNNPSPNPGPGGVKGFVGEVQKNVQQVAEEFKSDKSWLWHGKNALGVVIVLIGAILLLNQLIPRPWFPWNLFWPLIIIVLGLIVLRGRAERK